MSLRCVVDASVGVKLFIASELSDRADALFAHLQADPPAQLYVPELFFVECANVLWKYTRWSGYSNEQALQDARDLAALALIPVSNAELIEETMAIAVSQRVTAYDACYVAVGQREGIPLLTADEKLVRALAGKYDVRWLGDFATPLP